MTLSSKGAADVGGCAKPTLVLPLYLHTLRGCGDLLQTQGHFGPGRARPRQGGDPTHMKAAEVRAESPGQ